MATVKKAQRTFWHREATGILRQLLARRRAGYKELARLLEDLGEREPEKTLSNKINRGTYSFQFFLKCMAALGIEDVRFSLPSLSAKDIEEIKREARATKRRTFPSRPRARGAKEAGQENSQD